MHKMDRRYIPGDRWVRCDECGFGYRLSQIQKGVSLRQKGHHVCPDCFDYRHPNTDWRLQPKQEGKLIGGNIGAAEGTGTNYDLPSSDNLLVHYKFNESSGTTADDATGNYDGTITGTVTWETGKSGNCISSAAGDAYVTIPTPSINLFSSAFTNTFWMKPDDGHPSATQILFGLTVSSIDTYYVGLLSTGKLTVRYITDGKLASVVTSSAIFADGAASSFTHIAISISNVNGIKLYIDGEGATVVETGFSNVNTDKWVTTIMPPVLAVSLGSSTFSNYFYGDVDDFRIYRGIITDNQALGFV